MGRAAKPTSTEWAYSPTPKSEDLLLGILIDYDMALELEVQTLYFKK